MARGKTNSSNIMIIRTISISWIACIVAEVAIVARPVETLVEVMEEADFVEMIGFEADQAIHLLAYVRRDVTYAQGRDAGQISILRKRGIKLTMTLKRCQR